MSNTTDAENTLPQLIAKAEVLVEALPYIKRFSGETLVIKYGGSLMLDQDLKERFASDIVLLKFVGINPIIVHGGGNEISKWMKRVGKDAVFIDGLRVTDSETMEITEMVLSGKINSEIVSLINKKGGKAVGLSGKDSNLFKAHKIRSKDDKDLGLVGEIDGVDAGIMNVLSGNGYIPVISSVGESKDGETLNINADNAAAAVAIGMKAHKLIYLTDVPGILKGGKLVSSLDLEEAERLMTHQDITGGMIPKLGYAIRAIKRSVRNVHIINGANEHAVLLEIFTDKGIGTMISHKKDKN